MCESIGQFGLGLKLPSMYELRVRFLKKELEATEKAMVEHKSGHIKVVQFYPMVGVIQPCKRILSASLSTLPKVRSLLDRWMFPKL